MTFDRRYKTAYFPSDEAALLQFDAGPHTGLVPVQCVELLQRTHTLHQTLWFVHSAEARVQNSINGISPAPSDMLPWVSLELFGAI